MLLGDLDYPVAEAVIFFILILSLVFNTFLFYRGQGNYSIKYQLMRNTQFFRRNIIATYIIEAFYKFFFVLPFILLITLSIMAAVRDVNNLAPILINGLIILLILYPIKNNLFYYRLFVVWLLTIGSQLATFFIYQKNGEQAYMILSVTLYTANVLFFYLGLISIENVYWEIGEGVQICKEEVVEINSRWAEGQLPQIFDGGLYGKLTKSPHKKTQYLVLYLISLVFLVAYALIVHYVLGTRLGYVGLVSAVIYDIFIQIFNALDHPGRSTKTVYYVLVISRLLSFVFGLQNWLLGYCVLYFLVSIFIGWIVIDKHLPLKQQIKTQQQKQRNIKFLNALKSPQFVLLVLTVQIVIMILVEAYALNEKADPELIYNNVSIPIWQWGILVLVGAWIVIIYMVSVRIFIRYRNKIFSVVNYFFGIQQITEYHIYIGLSYALLVGLGVYGYLYLQQKLMLISCIFLPLIYVCFLGISVAWTKNNYKILADTEQYNKEMIKKYEIAKRRNQLIQNNEKLKNYKKQMMLTNYRMKNTNFGKTSLKQLINSTNKQDKLQQADIILDDTVLRNQNSNLHLNSLQSILNRIQGSDNKMASTKGISSGNEFVPLKDWRNPENEVHCTQIWGCLTPNDKKIIVYSVIFLLLWIGYCLASMIWCQSKFAISFFVCVIVLAGLVPYAKFYQTREDLLVGQIILNWSLFVGGITYWSVFNSQVYGPIAFSISYIVLALPLMIKCYQTEFQIKVIIHPAIQILLCIIFIEITLSIHKTVVQAAVFGIIFFILVVLQIPVFFYLTQEHVPKIAYIVCSVLIGSAVITISVLGYIFKVLSSFQIFTIIMILIYISFFIAAIALYANKLSNLQKQPNIYSAYGQPRFYFDSAKQMLKPNNTHIILFSCSMVTVVVYSVIVSVFFTQKEWSVYGLALYWLMDFFISLQSAMSSYLTIGKEKKNGLLTQEIIKEALLKLKNYYMSEQIAGDDSPEFQRLLEQAKQNVADESDSEKQAQNWKKVVQYHDLYIKNLKQEERFLFFWTGLIMFNLAAKKKQQMFNTLNELKNIRQQLLQNGIILQALQQNLKPSQKYEKVLQQIQNLQPIDFLIYQQILESHRLAEIKKKQQSDQIHKKQEEQNAKRNEDLYNQLNLIDGKALDGQEQINKFKELIKMLGKKRLFYDEEFPANENSLGELQSKVTNWKRPNIDSQKLIKGGISANDVRQGRIGDCYLVSSFAVLGQERIMEALGFDKKKNQVWVNQKGAYMVRFFKFGKQVYIIIDDLLPVDENQNWIFARSEEPDQFWPCILEKAYAKMYGGYHKIIQGKNHQVFAQFTGGFPYQIMIEAEKSNPYGLWNKVITNKNNGYLLAAGSPTSKNGDADVSRTGIVQGHAYSILDAKQIQQFKLIKLKNPHGSLGVEWKGQFSDQSDQMNKRMMSLLGHDKNRDGIFWMAFEDFICEFKSIYVCAVFDDRWIKFGPILGEFKQGINSFGTPKYDGIQRNPHFGITVTKKCNFFACLTQQSISALKGKNPIFMLLMRNQGKRLYKQSIDMDKSVGRFKRPINSVSISLEVQIEANSYPYTLTLMLACSEPGMEGKYNLVAYCDDKNAQIIQDQKFDVSK